MNPAVVSAPWLTTTGRGYVFWAPVNGETTQHSEHTRTELVSLTDFREGSGRHTLRATASVQQLPTEKPDVILGQIHGAANLLTAAFVMLHYRGGEVDVIVKKAPTGTASTRYPLLTDVPLNEPFTFTITDQGNGSLTFTADHSGQQANRTVPIPPPFLGATVRFQAGAYQQADSRAGGENANDGAEVTFTELNQSHTNP